MVKPFKENSKYETKILVEMEIKTNERGMDRKRNGNIEGRISS